jgi:L-arabinonolactonase
MGIRIDFVGQTRSRLGESPLWDVREQALYWVDSLERRICRWQDRFYESWTLPQAIGSIALGEYGLLAALRDGFYHVQLASEAIVTPIALPERDNSTVRFNDGKADREGHFLAGTMRVAGETAAPGILYRLEKDGNCIPLERGIEISNALCFSPAGDRLYFADSLRHVIWSYDYDAGTGAIGARRTFVETNSLGSVPDGATVDAAGDVWVALVQAQRVARFTPDGNLVQTLSLPIPYPSCPAFGGDDLSTLFVTTIADSGQRLRTDHPDAGRVLAITGLDTVGLPEVRCPVDSKFIPTRVQATFE